MRNIDKDSITEAFIGYFGENTDPRTRFVMARLAHHLHAFARETDLTHDEWRKGIAFMRKAGDISNNERDEFVLLSDVLGLSSLVDMLHSPEEGTSSSVLGPFHIEGAPPLAIGGDLQGDVGGETVLVEGYIRANDGKPISGASVDIWQTAPNGLYSSQDPNQDTYSFHGLLTTGSDGRYAFTTVRPVPYTVPTDGPVGEILNATGRHPWRPSHLHFIIKAEGYRTLVTEVFPEDDPYLDHDTVFGVRSDLILRYEPQPAGTFPEGYAVSGKIEGSWSKVNFDLILTSNI